jgi:hypothetical protein
MGSRKNQAMKVSQVQIPLPSRESITQHQVSVLLSSIATLLPFFHISHDNEEGGAMDGGTRSSIQTSMIKLCGRLDKIVDDDARWSIDETKRLEQHLAELYTQNIKVLKLQQQQIYHLAKPHVRHSPGLYKLEDGTWAAILGDVNYLNNAIVGVGGCPAQALEAFDEVFNGNVPIHLQAWMSVREEALAKNLKPPTKAEYDEKMERSGSGNPDPDAGGGSHLRDNCNGAGQDPESSGTESGPSSGDPKGPRDWGI